MMIYKLFRADEWADLVADGETRGAPIDRADGFVHFSTAAQVRKTAELYFADVEGLWLIGVEADDLGADLKWETSRGGDLFPHLFRTLRRSDVVSSAELVLRDGAHVFPDLT